MFIDTRTGGYINSNHIICIFIEDAVWKVLMINGYKHSIIFGDNYPYYDIVDFINKLNTKE